MIITLVYSEKKKPLENAKLTYDGKTYTTHVKGELTISNVTPGNVTVYVSDDNYHNGSNKVEVTPNGQGTGVISLTPDNGTMKITVVDSETKKPLENAKVTYDGGTISLNPEAGKVAVVDSETNKPLQNTKVTYNGKTYTTNVKGEVTISNVTPGDVTVDGSDFR